jgi:hypothetical protein
MKKVLWSILLAVTSLVSTNQAEAAFKKNQFKKNQIAKVGSVTCGFIKSWVPVARSGKSYARIAKPSASQKAACKGLLVASKLSLAKLPDLSKIVGSSGSSIQTVSGTAPTLAEVFAGDAASTFWRPGVVSSIATGTPTVEQCGEFFSGRADGESGGYLACYLSQNSGQALAEVVRAGTTICYLKSIPSAEVFNSGGLSIRRGSLPSGGITSLFSTPDGSAPRIVRIGLSAGGQDGGASTGILKIFSANQNAASGDLYRYEMVFCEGNANEPQEVEQTRITSRGQFVSSSFNTGGGGEGSRFAGTVRAFLRSADGTFAFDSTRDRLASFVSVQQHQGETFSRTADVTITAGNEIINKEYSVSSRENRKAYSVSQFAGSGVTSIRFLEGAIKQSFAEGEFNGATEFRDSVYVAAPANSYVTALSAVDLQSDSFFTGTPSPASASASVGCDTVADIEVDVEMSNEAVRQITQLCESGRLPDGVNFCSSTQLLQAQERYNSVCR